MQVATPTEVDIPLKDRPLPPHPLAFLGGAPPCTESFDTFERRTLQDWGYDPDSPEDAYGLGPHPWRKNLRRTWDEAVADTIAKRTTPLRLALLQRGARPARPEDDERDGILGRQIAKAAFMREHPDVFDIEIEPIILVGQNRTGTTMLHRLLALDGNARSAKAWELMSPLPPPEEATYGTDPREDKARKGTKGINDFLPDLKYCHEMDFTKPEECIFAMNDDLEMGHCINTPGQPTHRLLDGAEMESVYASHKRTLQIMSYRYPSKSHWVLKCPSHLPHLQALVRLFPKARFVWTHRPMDAVISSYCRTTSVFAVMSVPDLAPSVMGRHVMEYYSELVPKGMDQRNELGNEDLFVDINFSDLIANPIEQVRRIYEQFRLDFTEEFETRLGQYLREDAEKRSELALTALKPKPTLEEYGLGIEEVETTFAAYHERFLGTNSNFL